MIQKAKHALVSAYLKAKLHAMKFQQEEDGMETLEVVILVAIAVIIAGIIISALQGEDGLVATIFKKIGEWLDDLFART